MECNLLPAPKVLAALRLGNAEVAHKVRNVMPVPENRSTARASRYNCYQNSLPLDCPQNHPLCRGDARRGTITAVLTRLRCT